LALSSANLDCQGQWATFTTLYGKKYSAEEQQQRYEVFCQNMHIIAGLNKKHNPKTYFAPNQFSDLTREEYAARLTYKPTTTDVQEPKHTVTKNVNIPTEVDWRTKGVVTPVRSQGQCGSGLVFGVLETTESCYAIAHQKLVLLSLAQIVDCADANSGCNGGLMSDAWSYIQQYGLESNQSYPVPEGSCKYDPTKVIAKISKVNTVASSDAAVTEALVNCPVAAAIDASQSSFQFYSSGIYSDPACSTTQIDHAVELVGYGVSRAGTDYYILKNSWGTGWGMAGYMFIERGGNMCGITTEVTYPTME